MHLALANVTPNDEVSSLEVPGFVSDAVFPEKTGAQKVHGF